MGDIMKKKKKVKLKISKKSKIIILIVFGMIFIVCTILIIFLRTKSLKIVLKNNNKVEINSKINNTDMITSIKNGKIISKKENINTSKLGKKKIKIKVKNYFNKTKIYTYNINIVDTKKPTIEADDVIIIIEGDELDLQSKAKVSDNSKEKIKASVKGEYDSNKVGSYNLNFVAKDSSGNVAKKKFTLEVKEKEKAVLSSENGSFTTSKGFKGKVIDGITYINGILIANKTYSLPSSYYPGGLTNEFNNAFNQMKSAASNDGINIYVVSGFRSYNTQNTLYNNYVNRDGRDAADTYSARPGHSEHQTGLAADFNMVDDDFEYTAEGKWLNDNAYKYGFILRYPKGKTKETGYIYESWHYRYVGVDLASKLYNDGNWISLENHFGITSQY